MKTWINKNRELIYILLVLVFISLIIGTILLYQYIMRKRNTKKFPGSENVSFVPATEASIKSALQKVKDMYGKETAINVEKIFRWETRHFQSGGFKNTNAPGMEAVMVTNSEGKKVPKSYPYGWTSLKSFWDANPKYKPMGIYTTPENVTGIIKPFLIFPTIEGSMLTLAFWLQTRRPGNWFSTMPEKQLMYENSIVGITPRIVNTLA